MLIRRLGGGFGGIKAGLGVLESTFCRQGWRSFWHDTLSFSCQSDTLSAVKQGGGGRTGTMTGGGRARHKVGMGVGLGMTKSAKVSRNTRHIDPPPRSKGVLSQSGGRREMAGEPKYSKYLVHF